MTIILSDQTAIQSTGKWMGSIQIRQKISHDLPGRA
jgi:hypothetical protein